MWTLNHRDNRLPMWACDQVIDRPGANGRVSMLKAGLVAKVVETSGLVDSHRLMASLSVAVKWTSEIAAGTRGLDRGVTDTLLT